MIKLARTIRPDLILIKGEDAIDLFDYFKVDELHGLTREGCLKRIEEGGTYIDGMCNEIPEVNGKKSYYIFINQKTIFSQTREHNFGLIFHEACHYVFRKYWKTLQEDEEELITEAENLAIDIYRSI